MLEPETAAQNTNHPTEPPSVITTQLGPAGETHLQSQQGSDHNSSEPDSAPSKRTRECTATLAPILQRAARNDSRSNPITLVR